MPAPAASQFKQSGSIAVAADQVMKKTHLFFNQCGFAPLWKHGIKCDDIKPFFLRVKPFKAICMNQVHPGKDLPDVDVIRLEGTLQTVLQENMNNGRALYERDITTQCSQHESITSKPGGDIGHARFTQLFQTDSPCDGLSLAAPMEPSMSIRPSGKINVERLGTGFLQGPHLDTVTARMQQIACRLNF